MIQRPRHLADIERVLAHNPVCALLGPRQCGKTTLARALGRRRRLEDGRILLDTGSGLDVVRQLVAIGCERSRARDIFVSHAQVERHHVYRRPPG